MPTYAIVILAVVAVLAIAAIIGRSQIHDNSANEKAGCIGYVLIFGFLIIALIFMSRNAQKHIDEQSTVSFMGIDYKTSDSWAEYRMQKYIDKSRPGRIKPQILKTTDKNFVHTLSFADTICGESMKVIIDEDIDYDGEGNPFSTYRLKEITYRNPAGVPDSLYTHTSTPPGSQVHITSTTFTWTR